MNPKGMLSSILFSFIPPKLAYGNAMMMKKKRLIMDRYNYFSCRPKKCVPDGGRLSLMLTVSSLREMHPPMIGLRVGCLRATLFN